MKKILKSFKKNLYRLQHLDKTKSRFFIITTTITFFCLFVGTTYSYFNISKSLNSAIISIAKLKYELTSSNDAFTNHSISVPAGETVFLDLNLKSLNGESTRYALNNVSNNSNIKIYYSENNKNNMEGQIGINGSNIDLRVVIVNSGTSEQTATLSISGGYLQNTIHSNITEGYFENDLTVRNFLMDENMENITATPTVPEKTSEYAYLKTSCSDPTIQTKWNTANWNLEISSIKEKATCDVYFKKVTEDLEIYLVEDSDGTFTIKDYISRREYTFKNATCNNEAIPKWNNTEWKLEVSNSQEKTICTAFFTKNPDIPDPTPDPDPDPDPEPEPDPTPTPDPEPDPDPPTPAIP